MIEAETLEIHCCLQKQWGIIKYDHKNMFLLLNILPHKILVFYVFYRCLSVSTQFLSIITSWLLVLPLLISSLYEEPCFWSNQHDLFKLHIRGWPLQLYSEEGSFCEFFVMRQQFCSFSLGIALVPVFSNKKYGSVLSPSHAIKQKSNRFFYSHEKWTGVGGKWINFASHGFRLNR